MSISRLLRSQPRRLGLGLGGPARPAPRQPPLYHRLSSHPAKTGHFYSAANRTFLLGVDKIKKVSNSTIVRNATWRRVSPRPAARATVPESIGAAVVERWDAIVAARSSGQLRGRTSWRRIVPGENPTGEGRVHTRMPTPVLFFAA